MRRWSSFATGARNRPLDHRLDRRQPGPGRSPVSLLRPCPTLSDSRGMKVIKQSDQDWINQDLFPRAFAAGLKRVGVVVPTRDLAMINLAPIVGRIRL